MFVWGPVMCAVAVGTPQALSGQQLTGVIRNAETLDPIRAATVSLLSSDGAPLARVMSDSTGRFRIMVPGPGSYGLEVRQIGYAAKTANELDIGPDGITEVAVLLHTEPVALEAVVVETRSRRAAEEMARGTPLRLLTRNDIEEVERTSAPRHVGDLARRFGPDVLVRQMAGGGICIESTQRVRRTWRCDQVLVTLDGVPMDEAGKLLKTLPIDQIESLEFLKPIEAGLRFGTLGGNGVLLISTRGGGEWAARHAEASDEPKGTQGLAFAGVVSGVGGGVAGAMAACGLFECPFGSLSRNTAGIELGFTTALIPLGIHIANRRRGSFMAGLGASALVAIGGFAAWDATGSDLVFVATPLIQVVASVLAEQLTVPDRETVEVATNTGYDMPPP